MTDSNPIAPSLQPAQILLTAPSGTSAKAPIVYFNGFAVALGNADITVTLNLDNGPTVILKCSFTEAKSLAEQLKKAVDLFERMTDHKIMTADQVHQALSKFDKQ